MPYRQCSRRQISRPGSRIPAAALLPLLMMASCSRGDSESLAPAAPLLRLSMIPTTDPGAVVRESQRLVEYLEQQMSVKIELTVPTHYAAVVEAIVNGQVDIAYLGGFTYVQAVRRAGVVALVQRYRDRNFHSVFVTQAESTIASLPDLRGRTFAFGDVNSTSGHLMPRYFLREAGLAVTDLSNVIYSGGHDATALAVANGKVDAGALDETVFDRMTREGKLDSKHIRVFHTTPAYFDYVWAARPDLQSAWVESFADALLQLDSGNPAHAPLLDLLAATGYVRARDSDYEMLRQAAGDAGLLR